MKRRPVSVVGWTESPTSSVTSDRRVSSGAEHVEERRGVGVEVGAAGHPAAQRIDERRCRAPGERGGEVGSALEGRPGRGAAGLMGRDAGREVRSSSGAAGTTTVTGSPSRAAIVSPTSDLPERVPPTTTTITGRAGR